MADDIEKSIFSIRPKLKEAKNEIAGMLNEEQEMVDAEAPIERNVWNLYEGRTQDYDISFSDILKDLGFSSFTEWLEQRKQSGQTTHILDLMGGNGTFLRHLSKYGDIGRDVNPAFDKSLVVTLADERSTWEGWIEEDKKRRVSIVAGDIAAGKTWVNVDEWMKKENIPAFDLVVCRGVEGVRLIPLELYPFLLDKFYTRTTDKKGLIISQLTDAATDEQVGDWSGNLNKITGVRSYFQPLRNTGRHMTAYSAGGGFPSIAIEKTESAPQSLKEITKNLRF